MSNDVLVLLFSYFPPIKSKKSHATGDRSGRPAATKISIGNSKGLAYDVFLIRYSFSSLNAMELKILTDSMRY